MWYAKTQGAIALGFHVLAGGKRQETSRLGIAQRRRLARGYGKPGADSLVEPDFSASQQVSDPHHK